MSERRDLNHTGAREASPAQIERVLAVLDHHRGERNAIKRALLCELAGIPDQGRTLTAACREITLDQTTPEVVGLDMASGAVYLCQTRAEVDRAYAYHHHLGTEHYERAQAIAKKAAWVTAAQPLMPGFDVPVEVY